MIILDTNIVLEILEKREHLPAVIGTLQRYEPGVVALTTLTLSNVFYVMESHKKEIAVADKLLRNYKVIDVTAENAEWAFTHYQGQDFEDALQVAAAIRAKCSLFLTLDSSLAKKYGKFLAVELIG